MTSPGHSALIDEFNDNGFVIIPAGVHAARASRLRADAEALFQAKPWLWSSTLNGPSGTPWSAHERAKALRIGLPDLRAVFVSSDLVEIVRALMDDGPVLRTDGNIFRRSPSLEDADDESSNTHIHHYAHITPARASVMAWIALEDIAPDAGPMWICPESHIRNADLFDRALEDNDLRDHLDDLRRTGAPYGSGWVKWFLNFRSRLTLLLDQDIARHALTRLDIMAKAGDVLLFHGALTHGTHRPTRSDATRWSVVNRYQGRNAEERSWASIVGSSVYPLALEHVPPASLDLSQVAGENAWLVGNANDAHEALFWSHPLPITTTKID